MQGFGGNACACRSGRVRRGTAVATWLFISLALGACGSRQPYSQLRAALVDAGGADRAVSPANGPHEQLPITRDADLEVLVQLYRSLPERQRRTLVAVVRATAGSLASAAGTELKVSSGV